ncbi:histone H2B.1, sperm-like [Poecile atricapillus]|uniref:histone H2B.1, sperm-like n=1 Tax=Poecile atricapillus TaxID=48891 RepID=UPI002739EC04|nr:histone H2B.1, sperm-like [Poecile atricapillus]XP_058714010.1 histone H2B.1, sperm-like [Poecile atricapillus]
MEPGPPALHGPFGAAALPEPPEAAEGCAWQSLRCLRVHRQKKKVAYFARICKLLNQKSSTGDSCLVASVLAWLDNPQLLGDVALEASRLSRYGRRSHLGHREVLLAVKLVLLRELYKPPPGS